MQSSHYAYQSSPYYSSTYTYQTSPTSPYYTTYNAVPLGKSPSKHKRRATADGAYAYAYASPQADYYYDNVQDDRKPKRSSSHRHHEHVSSSHRRKSKTTRDNRGYTTDASGQQPYRSSDGYAYYHPQQSTHQAYTGRHADSREQDWSTAHERKYRTSPPPDNRQSYPYPGVHADRHAYHTQVPKYQETPKTRTKRSSSYAYATKPTGYSTSSKPRHAEPQGHSGQATDADARRAGIPAGFSLKHWDPTEEPILLLGSVFDANSLGKWIYDWTVATHGAGTPLTEVAGDLWLLLIQLAGKIKRAEEKINRIGHPEDKELIEDFLESGERLWSRFSKLLKVCEAYMLKSAKKHSHSSKKVVIGKDSGNKFVKCIFGRDHELEKTEKVMTGIRLWSMRFDANCDEILRYA